MSDFDILDSNGFIKTDTVTYNINNFKVTRNILTPRWIKRIKRELDTVKKHTIYNGEIWVLGKTLLFDSDTDIMYKLIDYQEEVPNKINTLIQHINTTLGFDFNQIYIMNVNTYTKHKSTSHSNKYVCINIGHRLEIDIDNKDKIIVDKYACCEFTSEIFCKFNSAIDSKCKDSINFILFTKLILS